MSDLSPMVDSPLVSIIVPSFNQGSFIGECIDSILNQDYRPIEVLVIDGASTDSTPDVLKFYEGRPEFRFVSEPDGGVVDAVNKGFRRVRGDVVGIQSSDDVYLPGAIRHAVESFLANPGCGLVYGDTVKIDADGREVLKCRTGAFSILNLLTFKTWIPQPSAFFRREMLEICGGWNDAIPYAPDTDLWLRMAFRAEVCKIDRFLSQRRIHEAQRDKHGDRIIRDFCAMIDGSLDIAESERSIRDAARAAKRLIRVRYGDDVDAWAKAWHLFCAGLYHSEAADPRMVFWYLTLPMRRQLSKLKQALR